MDSFPLNRAERRLVLCAMAVLGCVSVVTQLALIREMLTVFEGNEMAVGVKGCE